MPTGRGGFRVRARWEKEDIGRGQYQIVVTEIPYQVQKARLIERIAELLQARKLALLADVRDESAEDVRIVLEPKSRTVEAELLMEMLFRQTELENRIGLNMNMLDAAGIPRVMTLKQVLQAFLDHRRTVLLRRTAHRLAAIAHRLDVLGGYLVAYLNLDEVIRIVREEDEPKAALMAAFGISDVQADAILNMRLRALRRLEEAAIGREHEALEVERAQLEKLEKSARRQKTVLLAEIAEIKERFGQETVLGARRTAVGGATPPQTVPVEAMVEREPITVTCSAKGWIRAVKGHAEDDTAVRYKDGDRERFRFHAETTDKLLLFATNGRFYTLAGGSPPRRARLRRARAPYGGPRQRSRAGRAVRSSSRPGVAGGGERRARLLRLRGRCRRPDPHRAAGAQRGAGGRRPRSVSRRPAIRSRSSAATGAC